MSTWDGRGEGFAGRSWIPYSFFVFFAVVFLANGIMVYVAVSTFSGIETKSHYVRGLTYDRNLADEAAQEARGWRVETVLVDDAAALESGRYATVVTLADDRGGLLTGARVELRFERPTHDGHDTRLRLVETAAGRYEGVAEVALPGQWDTRLLVWHADGSYQRVERVILNGR